MFCSHVRYVCLYVCMHVYMYVCMHVCTKSFLKTKTNSSCVCTHLANKADSDSDNVIQNKQCMYIIYYYKGLVIAAVTLTGRSNPCLILTKHLIQISTFL